MISIVSLINVTDWKKDGDNDNDMRIEESINSVVEQTYKKWELRIVLYGYSDKNTLIDELKKYVIKYNSVFEEDAESEKDEYKIIIITYPEVHLYTEALERVVSEKCIYDYIALMDIGDIWSPNKLQIQASKLAEFKRIEVLGSKSIYKDEVSNNGFNRETIPYDRRGQKCRECAPAYAGRQHSSDRDEASRLCDYGKYDPFHQRNHQGSSCMHSRASYLKHL